MDSTTICRLCGDRRARRSTVCDPTIKKFLKSANITIIPNEFDSVCSNCHNQSEIACNFIDSVKLAQIKFRNNINITLKKGNFSEKRQIESVKPSVSIRKVKIPFVAVSQMKYNSSDDDDYSFDAQNLDFTHQETQEILIEPPSSKVKVKQNPKTFKPQHQLDNDYKCVYCKLKFTDFAQLVAHLKEQNCRVYTCNECDQKFGNDKNAYKKHLTKHHRARAAVKAADLYADAICDSCGEIFRGRNALNIHIETVHKVVVRKGISYTCNVCKAKLPSQKELIAHLLVHQKEEKVSSKICEYCGSVFYDRAKYVVHVRTHHLKPLICDHCARPFTSKPKLLDHMHVHTGLKLFKCQYCSITYAKHASLFRHRRQKHPEAANMYMPRRRKKFK